MRERPILFNGDMVRAILEGRKTVTRRAISWRQTPFQEIAERYDGSPWPWREYLNRSGDCWYPCPFGVPGDRLWVRESFSGPHCMECADALPAVPPSQWPKESPIWFWADGDPAHGDWTRPRPSIHMPRWASRILLEVAAVRVERLQDITEEQAQAEGIDLDALEDSQERYDMVLAGSCATGRATPITAFRDLWLSTGGDWDANPWVWVIEFKRVEAGHA